MGRHGGARSAIGIAAFLVVACGSTPVQPTAVTPISTPPAATAVPSAPPSMPSASPTPAASSSEPSPTPGPTMWPAATYGLTLPIAPGRTLALDVLDFTGLVVEARPADPARADAGSVGPFELAVRPGDDASRVVVGWTGGLCDTRGVLEVGSDRRTLALRMAPAPACDAVGIGMAVELRFSRPVEAPSLEGTVRTDLVGPTDVEPQAVWFATPDVGWIAGSTGPGIDAIVLGTRDGGRTWSVAGLGEGTAIAIAGSAGRAIAGLACPDGVEDSTACGMRTYGLDPGDTRWSAVDASLLEAVDLEGRSGIGAFVPVDPRRDEVGFPIADVRTTADGGATWADGRNPCPRSFHLVDVDAVTGMAMLALCAGQGGTGDESKLLFRSTDGAATWAIVATHDAHGGTLPTGSGPRLSIAKDGTGWMAVGRGPLSRTIDGGITWQPVDLADGDVRIANDAAALPGGAGYALVWDPDREGTFLEWTADGVTWEERYAWPPHPACCG